MEPQEGSEQREGHDLSQVLAGPLWNRPRLGDGAEAGQEWGGGCCDGPLGNGSGQDLLNTPDILKTPSCSPKDRYSVPTTSHARGLLLGWEMT